MSTVLAVLCPGESDRASPGLLDLPTAAGFVKRRRELEAVDAGVAPPSRSFGRNDGGDESGLTIWLDLAVDLTPAGFSLLPALAV